MGYRGQKLLGNLSSNRLIFTLFSAISLALLIPSAFFWVRAALNIEDELTWPEEAGWGKAVSLTSQENNLFVQIAAEAPDSEHRGSRQYSFHWRSFVYADSTQGFRTEVKLDIHHSRGKKTRTTFKAPLWWLVLIFSILPVLRMRTEMKSRKIVFGIVTRCAAVAVFLLIVMLNFLSDWTDHLNLTFKWPDPDAFRYGFPFVVRASDLVDDATLWVRWSLGGIVSNIMAAIALSFLAAVAIQFLVCVGRRVLNFRKIKLGHCRSCNYDLTGNVSGICPECGTLVMSKLKQALLVYLLVSLCVPMAANAQESPAGRAATAGAGAAPGGAVGRGAPAGRGAAADTAPERTRILALYADFLQLPLMHREGRQPGLVRLSVEADGKLLRYMNVEFPKEGQKPDFWYSADLREFKGQTVTLRYKSDDAVVLDRLQLRDQEIIDPKAYDGPNRPRFHFSPRLGWMNDINGSYYQDGLYHIFHQFNPASTSRGAGFDMHWGHSVSKDLVHWEEWPVALFPNSAGQVYSGTAVMQRNPIPGLNEGVKLPAPVLFFAATSPFSQHVATTPDGGRTWTRFAGNPVVRNMGEGDRDPKVIWHEASQSYVMLLYVGRPNTYRILRSTDLKNWEQTSVLPGWFECPEFVPMKSAVTGVDLMLLYGCYRKPAGAGEPFSYDSAYQLGRFDGKTFTPVTKVRNAHLGPNYYGALVFTNEPKGRSIMMGWARNTRFPGELFNQCASLPLHMQIKAINGEDTLCFEPAQEVNALRGQPIIKLTGVTLAEAAGKLQSLARDSALDVSLRFRPQAAGAVKVNIRSIAFTFDSSTNALKAGAKSTQIHPSQTVDARFLIDRGIVESFWNAGEAAYRIASLPTDAGPALAIDGNAVIEELVVYPMADIWKK